MEDNGEEAVEGATMDSNAEFINEILENHVVTGDGLLVNFVYVHDFNININIEIFKFLFK